jgi:hypothetical protein
VVGKVEADLQPVQGDQQGEALLASDVQSEMDICLGTHLDLAQLGRPLALLHSGRSL